MMPSQEEIKKLLHWTANKINVEIELLSGERKKDFERYGKLYYFLKPPDGNNTPPFDRQKHALQRFKDMGVLLEVFSFHDLEEAYGDLDENHVNADNLIKQLSDGGVEGSRSKHPAGRIFFADYKNLKGYPDHEKLSYVLFVEPRKLETFLSQKEITKIALNSLPVKFDRKKPVLLIGVHELPLNESKPSFHVCSVMLKKKVGKWVDWGTIDDAMTGSYEKTHTEKSKRTWTIYYSAIRNINKRVKKIASTDDDLFTWQYSRVKRNA